MIDTSVVTKHDHNEPSASIQDNLAESMQNVKELDMTEKMDDGGHSGHDGEADVQSSVGITEATSSSTGKEAQQEDERSQRARMESVEQSIVPPALDVDVVREHVQENPAKKEDTGEADELQRLRNLVFASRGSKAQLPAGWETPSEAGMQADVVNDNVDVDNGVEDAAQSMIDRAIGKVGAEVSDSDEDDSASSSDEESSSSSSSSSSSGDSKGEEGNVRKRQQNRKQREAKVDADDSDDEDRAAGSSTFGPTTKNEVIEPTVDVPPYSIVPSEKDIRPLGRVHSIIDSVVVVSQDTGKAPGSESVSEMNTYQPVDRFGRKGEQAGEYSVLDTGSLLALEDRTVLGVVYETFGSVLEPLYALRFASSAQVNRDLIQLGKAVFYVPADSTYVLTRALRALGKGSDASNIWDEEVGDDEREFSDDEEEAEYKRLLKAVKKSKTSSINVDVQTLGSSSSAKNKKQRTAPFPSAPNVRHGLPMRPGEALTHRDADFGAAQRAAPLPYDDADVSGMSPAGGLSYNQQPHQYYDPSTSNVEHIRPAQRQGNSMRGRGRGRGGRFTGPSSSNYNQGSNNAGAGAVNPAFALLRSNLPSLQQPSYEYEQQQQQQQQQQQRPQQQQQYFGTQADQHGWNAYYASALQAQQQIQQAQSNAAGAAYNPAAISAQSQSYHMSPTGLHTAPSMYQNPQMYQQVQQTSGYINQSNIPSSYDPTAPHMTQLPPQPSHPTQPSWQQQNGASGQ